MMHQTTNMIFVVASHDRPLNMSSSNESDAIIISDLNEELSDGFTATWNPRRYHVPCHV